MKKKPQCSYCPRQWLKKISRIMKVCVILLLTGLTTLHAEVFSQLRKVSLEVSNQSLLNVLDLLQEKSGYTFLFSSSDLQEARKISLKIENKSVSEVLDVCLTGTDLSYELSENLIILKRREMTQTIQAQQKMLIQGNVKDKSGTTLPGVSVL